MGGGARTEEAVDAILAALRSKAKAGAGDAGAGLGVDLAGGAAGRVRASANPLMFASGALDVAPAGLSSADAGDVSNRVATTPHPGAASPRTLSGTPFRAADMADPTASASASSTDDVLAELALRVSNSTVQLARSLGNLGSDERSRMPPPPPMTRLAPRRAQQMPLTKTAGPRPHGALSLSAGQRARLRQLLLRLLKPSAS